MKIKLLQMTQELRMPDRAHYNDAGADVFLPASYHFRAHSTTKVPLGFGLEIPDGYVGFVFPKSSLSARGLVCELSPIDSGYRGEVHAIVSNMTNRDIWIDAGAKIGQIVLLPVVLAEFVHTLDNDRGAGAFGSTGA